MGATTVLMVEIEDPGTFQGIIAFEPSHSETEEKADAVTDMLVSITMRRPGEWNSWEEVLDHFKTGKAYRRWHPEAMEAYLQHGVRKRNDGKYVLATTPLQEASIYCQLTPELSFPRVKCPVTFEIGAKSYFFDIEITKQVVHKWPDKYSISEAIPNTTHSMVMEDPETCALHILQDLERFPLFQESAKL